MTLAPAEGPERVRESGASPWRRGSGAGVQGSPLANDSLCTKARAARRLRRLVSE